jgi:anthranilate 1,2-dioxygenase (deaminating, decarboxylating) large subunit
MQKCLKFIFIYLLCMSSQVIPYDLPFVNLGFTNILDGGPVRPTYGWYIYEFFQYYGSHKFLNAQGSIIDPSLKTTVWDNVTAITYQTQSKPILGAQTGISAGIPIIFSSTISKNNLGLTDSGTGFGDLFGGPFLQWSPITYKDRPIFVNRLEFDVSFPIGKNKKGAVFNPGNGFYYINPYWAATFYFTKRCAASWRLQYVWSSIDKKTKIQAGQAIFMNFDLEYELFNNFWFGPVGYFLQQITNSKVDCVSTPGRKEHIVALGPGALYERNDDLFFFGYVFFEMDAKNRTQGISAIARLVYHF